MTAAYANMDNPQKFATRLNLKSLRNVVVLCGSESVRGTCHHAFDNFLCFVIFNPLAKLYSLHWLSRPEHRVPLGSAESVDLVVPPGWNPYRRGLSSRATHAIATNHFISSIPKQQLLDLADFARFSEIESAAGDSSDTESNSLSDAISSSMSSSVIAADAGRFDVGNVGDCDQNQ